LAQDPRHRAALVPLNVSEVYFNGEFIPHEAAKVSVMDRGFLLGDGVYELVPIYGGHPRRLGAHLQRLDRSLTATGLTNPLDAAQWQEVFNVLLAGAGGADCAIYVQVTRGPAPERDQRFPIDPHPTVLAMAQPLKPRRPDLAETGIAAITRPDLRWHRCDIKATSLLATVLTRQEAMELDAEEAIMVRNGLAHEGSSSNLFLVRAGEISTPPLGPNLLAGVTRGLVLELAGRVEIPCREQDLTGTDLANADEIWITSSLREVLPVTRLDGVPVGYGVPGPLWARMNGLYQAYKERLRVGDEN
jgi:D-alanine transaminase